MTAFDPKDAVEAYATLDIEELVNIAYLDPGYLPEAKEIAVRELDRRGVLGESAAAGGCPLERLIRCDASIDHQRVH